MLEKRRKLSRRFFPSFASQKLSFNGVVLRIQCFEKKHKDMPLRFGVVVPKRFGKTAVERNRFKRVVLASIGRSLPLFEKLPYGACVVFPIKVIRESTREEIVADIAQFIAKYSQK